MYDRTAHLSAFILFLDSLDRTARRKQLDVDEPSRIPPIGKSGINSEISGQSRAGSPKSGPPTAPNTDATHTADGGAQRGLRIGRDSRFLLLSTLIHGIMVDRLVNSEANARRIAMVENCFGGSGQPLAVPGRVLVGEGVLTKMCRKKPKPRQFFLFNDILVYGNIVINKKKYNKQHIIPLEEVKLESLADEGQYRNGWLIKTVTKSFAVYAATPTEKQEWMAHITKCIEDLLRKSGKKPVEVHAAVWVPDNEATICMHCNKTQFTVLNRRHHCRQCGAVVCGPCSNKKLLLPGQGNGKAVRVCLQCYDAASKIKAIPTTAGDGLNNKDPQRNNSADSSGGDSSGDDDDGNKEENHDEPKFYSTLGR